MGLVARMAAIVTGFTRILNNRHIVLMSFHCEKWALNIAYRFGFPPGTTHIQRPGTLYNINKYYKLNNNKPGTYEKK